MSRYPRYSEKGVTKARNLRKSMTRAERKLWSILRDNQLGVGFRRQAPIGPYIVDFLAIKPRLIIELDGGQHLQPGQVDRDKKRTAFLSRQGYLVMRFNDIQMLKNPTAILQKIKEQVDARLQTYSANKPHPTLPS